MYMTAVYERAPGIGVPPPVIYLAGFGLGLIIDRRLGSADPSSAIRVGAGVAGLGLSVALDTVATLRFAKHRTPFNPARPARALVTDGPYRLTRNPMYVGMGCLYAGAAVASGSLWSLATLPAVLGVMDRVVIPREERHLTAVFGDDYMRYQARVPRWFGLPQSGGA